MFTEDAFHAGQRNDGTTCSWCHNPNRASSGWSADSTAFVHAIHAASKRTVAFTWHAVSATDNFDKVVYPGVLARCETCHLPGTYDYSLATSASAIDKRLYRTLATGTLASTGATYGYAPYITQDLAYGSGFSFTPATGVTVAAAGTTLVSSPTMTVCSACHTDDLAMAHMKQNGGSFYTTRTVGLATTETCLLCHASGKVADIAAVHAR